ncbi:hypothetical protein [Actinoallomurus vinaceus]
MRADGRDSSGAGDRESPRPEDEYPQHVDDVAVLGRNGPQAESWAAVDYRPGAPRFEVEQYGPRRLWDEAETAYLGWLRAGRPGLERLGVSVTTSGDQRFWLDSPDHPIG